MKLSRVAITVAVAILVVGAVGAGVATAHKKKFKTTVTIQWNGKEGPYASGDTFTGNVGSKKKKCRRDRTVKVFRVRVQGDRLIGTDKTNNRGFYVVRLGVDATPGDYFAKTKKKVIKKNAKHKHICKKGKSPVITVP